MPRDHADSGSKRPPLTLSRWVHWHIKKAAEEASNRIASVRTRRTRAAAPHPKKKDTGRRTRRLSQDIPQCWPKPRKTGVLSTPVTRLSLSVTPHEWTGFGHARHFELPPSRRDTTQSTSCCLQASRSVEPVRCQDDWGSYPRPLPDTYRLAQIFRDSKMSRCAAGGPPSEGECSAVVVPLANEAMRMSPSRRR